MTRVLHVVPTYWPAVRYGGTIASVHALARAQVSLGMKVDVLTTSVDGPQDLDVPLGEAVNRDGVHIRYHRVPWLRRLYRAPTLAESADAMLPGTSVVHLHSVFLWPTYAVARRAVRAGVPHVVSPRGMATSPPPSKMAPSCTSAIPPMTSASITDYCWKAPTAASSSTAAN